MPIVSPSRVGSSGPIANASLPIADTSGAALDSTTYNNTITLVGKLKVLTVPTDTSGLAMARVGEAFPCILITTEGLFFSDGTYEPVAGNSNLYAHGAGNVGSDGLILDMTPTQGNQAPRYGQVSAVPNITAGALPTQQLVSGAGAQISTVRDVETITPVTFNPGAATTATCTVALSPDNVTYSTVGVVTEPVGVAFDGTIHLVKLRVPAGWYVKLTVNAQAVLGLTTIY